MDPYAAAYNVMEIFQHQASFYRLNDHNVQFNIANTKFGIYDENNYFTIYKHNKSAVKKARTIPYDLIEHNLSKANEATSSALNSSYSSGRALINAVNFHALSIDAISEENQLLDLWAIFETILDISNKHTSDRIQQIVSKLVPILKQRYIYTLFNQLRNDIKNYSDRIYNEIIADASDSELLSVVKFVLLEEYSDKRTRILGEMEDFPLLKERIIYYNTALSTKEETYQFVLKHSNRICWQIMRIYRNRNLIIHNGRAMPYLSLLIENLHSYVDDFIDYMINGFVESKGMELIYQELFLKESEWITNMNVKSSLVDEETINYILS